MENISKISVKTVCGKVEAPEEPKDLMVVTGVARSFKTVTTTYGDSIGLKGDFIGVNVETGEMKRSNTCYLPEIALSPILSTLEQEDVNQVEIAVKIGIEPSDNPVKYAYYAEFLREPENDPIRALADDVMQAMKALPE